MQKESLLFFSFSSESIFGAARDTNKRAQYKIKEDLFLLSSERIFGETKVTMHSA